MYFKRWALTFAICVLLIAVLGYVKFTQIQAAIAFGESFPEPSETVSAHIVTESLWHPSLELTGETLARRSLTVRNELEGIITQVNFRSGEKVDAGSLLVQLDAADEIAQLAAVAAEITIAELEVSRIAKLLEANLSSRDEFDRANAALLIAKARAKSLEVIIARKTIVAPFQAVAGLHELEVGAFLSANSEVTRLVSDEGQLWLDFAVPQQYADLAVGQSVAVISEALLDAPETAVVIAIEPEVSEISRNVRVRALWENVPAKIKPGAIVKVILQISEQQRVYRLPDVAIRYDAFGAYVFRLNKDESDNWRAARAPVSVLATEEDYVIVASGVNNGDTIAAIGSSKLRAGLLARVARTEQEETAND